MFEEKLLNIFYNFYEKLDDIAYNKFEITAADIKNFKEAQHKKILDKAEGIVVSFLEAYQTLVAEYEKLIYEKYRVPSLQQRQEIEKSLQKLSKQFDRLLRIIKAKALVILEDIEDENLSFDKMAILQTLSKITFKEILDSLISGNYLYK